MFITIQETPSLQVYQEVEETLHRSYEQSVRIQLCQLNLKRMNFSTG